MEIPVDELPQPSRQPCGVASHEAVHDALLTLSDADRQILHLFFWQQMPQAEIARQLGIPLGTVKSRIHTAKEHFKKVFPVSQGAKGETVMKCKLPATMPACRIEPSQLPPFAVRCEEAMGWLIIPREGERISWGLYEHPGGRRTEYCEIQAVGKAEVHGVIGVELLACQFDAADYYRTGREKKTERRLVAQLTETHGRFLAESHLENGVRKCYTFLDGDPFLRNWGYGEENCGWELNLCEKGILCRNGNQITGGRSGQTTDVVGRCTVTLNGRAYDTICLMNVECFEDSIVSEQYVDRNGRTVLWRRFNHDRWAFGRYGKTWTEMLPQNERLLVNGEIYVHWYDCVSDYVFG
jgi:hypothetical protein